MKIWWFAKCSGCGRFEQMEADSEKEALQKAREQHEQAREQADAFVFDCEGSSFSRAFRVSE